jgi:hemoglobin-like flavoprotein
MDPQRLKDNFALVGTHGIEVAEFFYADLFEKNPGVRPLFSASMRAQQEKLLSALSYIVSTVDDPGTLVPFLQELGRKHEGFGALPEHFPAVGASLLATLEHFSGDEWNAELAKDWTEAYGVASQVMIEAPAA